MHAVSNCNSRVWCFSSCRDNEFAGTSVDPNEVHDGLTSSAAFSYQKSVMSSKEKGKKEYLPQPL